MTRLFPRFCCALLVTACLIAVASPVSAQQATPQPFVEHWYVTGAAGKALDAPKAVNFGLEIGERLNSVIQAYLNVAYFDDVMTDTTRAQLAALGGALTYSTATPWAFSGRDRARTVSGGARFLVPTGTVRPFVGVGVGAINVERVVIDQFRGEVSQQLFQQYGTFGTSYVDVSGSSTHPMGEAMVGVAAVYGRLHIEGSYRYRRAFNSVENLNIPQAGVAAGVSF